MADPQINPDELALRRRARRRLVGSLALALLAVVVLPMIFEPEPKPLGDDVEIVIPGQDTPFKPIAPGKNAPAMPPGAPAQAEAPARVTPAPELAPPPAKAEAGAGVLAQAAKPAPDKTKAAEAKATEAKPQDAKGGAASPAKPTAKPVETKGNEAKPAEAKAVAAKPGDTKPAASGKSESKTPAEAKTIDAKPGETKYYLQLGSFGAESNAKQLAEKARGAGFGVKIVGGQGGFKVRAGPYASKDKAVEAQASMKTKGFAPVVVAQ
jgi:DedD protein